MLLSLDEYRRHLRSTYDAVARAGDELEAQDVRPPGRDVMGVNSRYRRAHERERARRARGKGSRGLEG
jgi:hypothetical protein